MTVATLPRTLGWKGIQGHYLAAACGLALTVVAAVGVGAWQVDFGGGGKATTGHRISLSAPVDPGIIFYLVDSEAQALSVTMGEADAWLIRVAGDKFAPSPHFSVLLLGTPEDEALFESTLIHTNSIRTATGLDEARVVDVRAR